MNIKTQITAFLICSCSLPVTLWGQNLYPTTVTSEGRSVKCILPTSKCVVTDVKETGDAKWKGDTISLYSATYCFEGDWFTGGAAVGTKRSGNATMGIPGFKLRILSQPSLPSYPACKPGAARGSEYFGLDDKCSVRVLAVGPLDDKKYASAAKFEGQVFKVKSMVTYTGGCWYGGMLEKDGKVFIFPNIQIEQVK